MEMGKAMAFCLSSWVSAEIVKLSSSFFLLPFLLVLLPVASFSLLDLPCVGVSLLPLFSSLPPSLP